METSHTTAQYDRYNLLYEIALILSPKTDTTGNRCADTTAFVNGNLRKATHTTNTTKNMSQNALLCFQHGDRGRKSRSMPLPSWKNFSAINVCITDIRKISKQNKLEITFESIEREVQNYRKKRIKVQDHSLKLCMGNDYERQSRFWERCRAFSRGFGQFRMARTAHKPYEALLQIQ